MTHQQKAAENADKFKAVLKAMEQTAKLNALDNLSCKSTSLRMVTTAALKNRCVSLRTARLLPPITTKQQAQQQHRRKYRLPRRRHITSRSTVATSQNFRRGCSVPNAPFLGVPLPLWIRRKLYIQSRLCGGLHNPFFLQGHGRCQLGLASSGRHVVQLLPPRLVPRQNLRPPRGSPHRDGWHVGNDADDIRCGALVGHVVLQLSAAVALHVLRERVRRLGHRQR
mmetsp:Transcript_100326/g.287007  ORF Transcript_100326/g.287007 Transcript_100326/m.287007 type:complete len:225 (+) Transcript_100326:601-1275(+)